MNNTYGSHCNLWSRLLSGTTTLLPEGVKNKVSFFFILVSIDYTSKSMSKRKYRDLPDSTSYQKS